MKLTWVDAVDLEAKGDKYFKALQAIKNADGILIPGGFGIRGTEGKITACKYAREFGIPFLGVCLGL